MTNQFKSDTPKQPSSFELGRRAEEAALKRYEDSGYATIDTNVRKSAGEIDLILSKDSMVVFVEVKYRSSHMFGLPVEAVGKRKQQKVRGAAAEWLVSQASKFRDIRFDVASVDRGLNVEIYRGAF